MQTLTTDASCLNKNNDTQTPEKNKTSELFPSRLLGFGVFNAWSSLAVSLEIKLDIASLSSSIGRLFLLSLFTLLGYLFVAIFVHRTGRNIWTRTVFLTCAVLSVLFPILEFAAATFELFFLDIAAIVCYSVATVGFFLMWAVQISAHPPKTAFVAYSASFALSACIYFLVKALGTPIFFAALILLPILSCWLLHLSSRLPLPKTPENDSTIQWRIPWRPMALVVIFTLAFGLVTHFEGNAMVPSEFGRLLSGLIVLVATLTAFLKMEATTLAKISSLLVVGALLWCEIHGPESGLGVGKLLISVGYFGFLLFVLCTLSEICFSYRARPEWLFCIVQASSVIMTAPSGQLGNVIRESFMAGNTYLGEGALAALVLAVMAACMFLLTENPFAAAWGIKAFRRTDNGESEPVEIGNHLQNQIYRCALIARQYGLTHREEEVLALLAENKSFIEIETDLVIAHGTLRAHVQHLYEKLDVHSKQEVLDFVNNWE